MYPGIGFALTACGPAPSDSAVSTGDSASGDHAFDYGGDVTLRILSGSENQEPEGILDDFARERGVNIRWSTRAPWISCGPSGETVDYDAVWPASSLWLTAGDTQYRVKARPVHFHHPGGIPESARGLAGGWVSWARRCRSATCSPPSRRGLEFCMTSATQSQLRVQCLHRLPLRPAGQSGCDHVGEPPDPGPGGADHPAALPAWIDPRKL